MGRRQGRRALGRVGYDQAPYHHPRYEPMWAACQALGMVLHFHSGPAAMQDYFGANIFGAAAAGEEPAAEMPGALGIYVTEVRCATRSDSAR